MNRRAASIAVGAVLSWMLILPSAGAMPLGATLARVSPTVRPRPGAAARGGPVTVAAAGDIACDPRNALFNNGWGTGRWCRARAVEKVIQAVDPNVVLALGDEQYNDGRLKAFEQSYAKSW